MFVARKNRKLPVAGKLYVWVGSQFTTVTGRATEESNINVDLRTRLANANKGSLMESKCYRKLFSYTELLKRRLGPVVLSSGWNNF